MTRKTKACPKCGQPMEKGVARYSDGRDYEIWECVPCFVSGREEFVERLRKNHNAQVME